MEHFKEFVMPSLVTDVQSVFWEHIFPMGQYNRNQTLKNVHIGLARVEHGAMNDIIKKYPFLHRHLLVFTLPPNFATNVHMDGLGTNETARRYSCNIPIEGCDNNCITEFFEVDHTKFVADVPSTTRFLRPGSEVNKLAEYRLTTNPILTDTQFPHRVNNRASDVRRVSVSWTIDHVNWSWDKIANFVAV